MLFWVVIFLLCVKNSFGDESASTFLKEDDLSYEDIRELNVTCYPKDTCMEEIGEKKTCSCDSQCSIFGICCIDSPYRNFSRPTHQCRAANKFYGYYMVEKCLNNTDSSSMWKHMCESDEGGDVLKRVPVTSMDTNATYKNYYCFRCHETTGNFFYWEVYFYRVSEEAKSLLGNINISWTYDEETGIWVATNGEDSTSIPISRVFFSVPDKMPFKTRYCNPNIISDCPESWTDKITRDKCHHYTAAVYRKFHGIYKNVHCALCNYVNVKEVVCKYRKIPENHCPTCRSGWDYDGVDFSFMFDYNRVYDIPIERGGRHFMVGINPNKTKSETRLKIDLNQNKEGNISKCADGEFWQPVQKKCKKIICAVEGYVVKDGKCTAP